MGPLLMIGVGLIALSNATGGDVWSLIAFAVFLMTYVVEARSELKKHPSPPRLETGSNWPLAIPAILFLAAVFGGAWSNQRESGPWMWLTVFITLIAGTVKATKIVRLASEQLDAVQPVEIPKAESFVPAPKTDSSTGCVGWVLLLGLIVVIVISL